MLHNFFLYIYVRGAIYTSTGHVVSVHVFVHIVAAAVTVVTKKCQDKSGLKFVIAKKSVLP
jgi:hypothetical protein